MVEQQNSFLGDDSLLPIFLQETQEQLEVLDQGIVRLEQEPENTLLIQGIFRAAHTLKGSSGTMGLKEIAVLTHHMEDVFDQVRERTLYVTPEVTDHLLTALDLLHQMVGAVENGMTVEVFAEEILTITRVLAEIGTPSYSPAADHATAYATIGEIPDSAVAILVSFSNDCQMTSIRAYMVLQALKQCAEIRDCEPSLDDIELGNIEHRLLVTAETAEKVDEIRKRLLRVGEIEWVHVARGAAASSIHLNMPSVESTHKQVTPEAESAHAPAPSVQQTVRINVNTLDDIMNIVGEMVLDRTRIAGLAEELREYALNSDIIQEIETVSLHLGAMVSELHERVLDTRMLPVSQLFTRFPRMIRDLARKLDKQVNLVVSGESERLDRSVIEKLIDPLTHILRNAIDHGIETPAQRVAWQKPPQGNILLSALREENHICIEVRDDGAGIDVERVKQSALEQQLITPEQSAYMSRQEILALIFSSGLSTATQVSDVSGRGVGMDVVKRNIESLGGIIDINSEPGQGTRITLKIPLTLAIVRALLVRVGQVVMAIPLSSVEETIKVHREKIQTVHGRGLLTWRDRVVPVVHLSDLFPGCGTGVVSETLHLITISYNSQPVCLAVDHIIGHQEIVVKTLGNYLGNITGLAGATILGNARVALIVDIGSLFEQQLWSSATFSTWESMGELEEQTA